MRWLKARLREPASWSALAAAIGMWAPAVPRFETLIYAAAGTCATIGFVMQETGSAQ